MRVGALVTIAALCTQVGAAQFSFLRRDVSLSAHSPYGTSGLPWRLATGDFNGDRLTDLVTVSTTGISILLNRGNGNFAAARHNLFEAPGPVIAADFNGDGRLDLLSTGLWRSRANVLLGRGDGTFAQPVIVPGLAWPAAAGDFNGDGRIDVACFDRETTSFGILLGNGDGSFRPNSEPRLLFAPSALVTGDFDRDGNPDVAAAGSSLGGRGIFMFLSRADGTLKPAITVLVDSALTVNQRGDVLIAVDFNQDGLLDLITESAILRGKGDGTFDMLVTYTERLEDYPKELNFAAADFDQDGKSDLLAGSIRVFPDGPAGNTVSIFSGKGDGTIEPARLFVTGWGPSAALAADLDGDGRPDIATLNRIANTISLLLSREVADQRLVRAVSAASSTAIVAPGSIATLYSSLRGAVTEEEAIGPAWPEQLGGIRLEVRDSTGSSHTAPLQYVSEKQINFLVPEETAVGEADLIMIRGRESTQIGTMQVEDVAPAVFLVRPWSMTPLAYDIRIDAEGRKRITPAFACDPSGDCDPVPVDPSPLGSTLVFLVTGFRNASVDNVKCAISNLPLEVEFAGPSPTPGMQEIRVRVPAENYDFWDLPGGSVHLSIDGIAANMAQMAFRYPPLESRR